MRHAMTYELLTSATGGVAHAQIAGQASNMQIRRERSHRLRDFDVIYWNTWIFI